MVTIPQIRSRLLEQFPEPQADLLAHVFVESHDALVCAHTTTTLERPDSLGRWTFSIGNGGSSWDVVWIGRSWPSGGGGCAPRQ